MTEQSFNTPEINVFLRILLKPIEICPILNQVEGRIRLDPRFTIVDTIIEYCPISSLIALSGRIKQAVFWRYSRHF